MPAGLAARCLRVTLAAARALAAANTGADAGPDPERQLIDEGERQWRSGSYAAAARTLRSALESSRHRGDQAREALALDLLANVADSQGDQEAARQSRAAALELARALEDPRLEARVLADAGLGSWRRAEYAEATERCQQALSLYDEIADRAGRAECLSCLARILFKQGEYEPATERYREALALQEAEGSLAGQAATHEELGLLLADQRANAGALDHLQRSLALAEAGGDPVRRCRLLGEIGYLQLTTGVEAEAVALFRAALQVATQKGDDGCRASALSKLGGAALRRGRPRQALRRYEASLRLREAIGDRREQAWTLARIGALRAQEGSHGLALSHYGRALAIWEQIHDQRAAAWYLLEAARAHEALGNEAQALVGYERARQAAEAIHLPYLSLSLGSLGRMEARRGRREDALRYGARAVESAEATGNPEMRWNARYDLGRIQLALGLRDDAVRSFRESLDIIESLRAELVPVDEAKARWLEERQEVYGEEIALLVERGDAAGALEVAERARARAFLDLVGGRAARHRPAAEAEVAGPALVPPPGREAVRELVRQRGTTLVEYFSGRERTFIWVVTPEGEIDVTSSAMGRAELSRLIDAARRGLRADLAARAWEADEEAADEDGRGRAVRPAEAPLAPDPRPVLRRLYRALIGPVSSRLPSDPGRTVTIVPHEKMLLLSFAALLDEGGRYLVERHSLHYTPAIGLLQYTRAASGASADPPRVMVVGNPAMPTLPGRRQPLPPLPGAEHEAQLVARLFPPDRVTTLLGPRAEERLVRELAPQQTILHLATHGVIRDDAPLDSLLALAPSGSGEAGGDGLWTAREVLDLDLHADLVALSACNTGLGRVTGDGVLGLSRAFLAAGVPSLVVSLWRVADEVAGRQMEQFYRELGANGGDKADALRRAQVATIRALRDGRVRTATGRRLAEDPAYWAPFVVLGEAR